MAKRMKSVWQREISKPMKLVIASLVLAFPTFLYLGVTPMVPAVSAFGYEVNTVLNRLVSVCWTLVISSFCFLVVKVFLKRWIGLTLKGFGYGFFTIGWVMLIYTLVNFLSSLPYSQLETQNWKLLCLELAVTFVGCFEIGLVEEAIWRVLAIHLFRWVFGEGKKGNCLAVALSCACFGLSHINNLLMVSEIYFKTLSQVVYAAILGLFFALCYLKSQSILPAIVHHALFDFAYYGAYCFYPKELMNEVIATDISFGQAIWDTMCYLPILLYMLLLLTGHWERMMHRLGAVRKK